MFFPAPEFPAGFPASPHETPSAVPAHPFCTRSPGNRLQSPLTSIPSRISVALPQTAICCPCAIPQAFAVSCRVPRAQTSTYLVALLRAPTAAQINIAAGICGNYPAPKGSASAVLAKADEMFPPTKQCVKKFSVDRLEPETTKAPQRHLEPHHSRPAEPFAVPSAPRPAASPLDPSRCPRQK